MGSQRVELKLRSHLENMLVRPGLLLALLLCLGSPAPTGLLRQKRQLAAPGPSLAVVSGSTSAVGGASSLSQDGNIQAPRPPTPPGRRRNRRRKRPSTPRPSTG